MRHTDAYENALLQSFFRLARVRAARNRRCFVSREDAFLAIFEPRARRVVVGFHVVATTLKVARCAGETTALRGERAAGLAVVQGTVSSLKLEPFACDAFDCLRTDNRDSHREIERWPAADDVLLDMQEVPRSSRGEPTDPRDALPMTTWTTDELTKIGHAEELQIASRRRDGTLRNPVTIWVVRHEDSLYIRAVNGRSATWFRGTKDRHEGWIRAGGVERDVTFVDADHEIDDAVDAAYQNKYRRYARGIVNSVLTPRARAATIKVVPRATTS